MKKSIVTVLTALLLASAAVFSQDFTVTNKLGSDGLVLMKPDDNIRFGGVYDTVSGLIHFGKFSVQAEYRLQMAVTNSGDYVWEGIPRKTNVWFRPASWVEIAAGNHFYQALPGSYMAVYDNYTMDGNYGHNGLGATFKVSIVDIGLNVPVRQTWWDNSADSFALEANAGVNVRIPNIMNIGAFFKLRTAGEQTFGINANLILLDNLYLGFGYTFNGMSIAYFENGLHEDSQRLHDTSILFNWGGPANYAHLIAASFKLDLSPFTIGADIEAGIANNNKSYHPFYFGFLFGMDITKFMELNVQANYYARWAAKYASEWGNRNRFEIYPRLDFHIGNSHTVSVGCIVYINNDRYEGSITDPDPVWEGGFAVPVSWKYTF